MSGRYVFSFHVKLAAFLWRMGLCMARLHCAEIKLEIICVPHVICYGCAKTDHVVNMAPESPSRSQPAKPNAEYKPFCGHCNPRFQWLLDEAQILVSSCPETSCEKFLRLQVTSLFSRSMPAFMTPLAHVAAELIAHNFNVRPEDVCSWYQRFSAAFTGP